VFNTHFTHSQAIEFDITMQLTSIFFLVMTTIPPLVAGAGKERFRTAKSGKNGSVEIKVFIAKLSEGFYNGNGFSAAWLPGVVSKFPIHDTVGATRVQHLAEFEANLTPKVNMPKGDGLRRFQPGENYGFHIDQEHALFRRRAKRGDYTYQDIENHLYAKKGVVMNKKKPTRYPQQLYCFFEGENPGREYTPVKLDLDLGQTSGSTPVAGDVPVADDAVVAGGVQAEER
jgi:hypothetical protein